MNQCWEVECECDFMWWGRPMLAIQSLQKRTLKASCMRVHIKHGCQEFALVHVRLRLPEVPGKN